MKSLENKHIKSKQKCWDCKHAIPGRTSGCAWSEHFKPVEGWTAKPTLIKSITTRRYSKSFPSFQIDDCPKYEKGKVGAAVLETDKQTIQDLAYAVVEQAVRDWRWLCKGSFGDWDCNFEELTLFFTRDVSFYIGDEAAKRLWEQIGKIAFRQNDEEAER